MKKIIHCTTCNKILKITSYDKYPKFVFDKTQNEHVDIPQDDLISFFKKHKNHNLEKLSILNGTIYYSHNGIKNRTVYLF